MSRITQNNIVMWLEDVVPQMQKAEDPVDCLLKYAKDHNFSPAILERVGHMFNSLKTNSAYNLAKGDVHRGDYITTLDVPSLVEKYASIQDGADLDNLITVYKAIGLSDGSTERETIKLASDQAKVGDVSDLCFRNKKRVRANEDLNRFYEKLASAKKNASDNETPDVMKAAKAAVRDIEESREARQDAMTALQNAIDVKRETVRKFASRHYGDGFKDFDEFEHNLKAYIDDDGFDKVFDKFADDLAKTPEAVACGFSRKTAADQAKMFGLGDSEKIDERDANLVFDYYESEVGRVEAAKKTAAVLLQKQQQQKKDENRQNPTVGVSDPDNKKSVEYAKDDTKSKTPAVLNRIESMLNRQIAADSEGKKSVNKILETGDRVSKGITDASKAIYDTLSKSEQFYRSHQEAAGNEVGRALKSIDKDAILQNLLFTDPVLSTLDEDETDNVIEAYESIVQHNPSIATDKALLRSLLRQVANSGGVDAQAMTTVEKVNYPASSSSSISSTQQK